MYPRAAARGGARACSPRNAFNSFDVRACAAQVATPTLVFHVRGDAMVPFEAGRQLAAAIPGARFVSLDGSNHILCADEPAWRTFTRELDEFPAGDETRDADSVAGGLIGLTARERTLLDDIARGLTNGEIAARLHKSCRCCSRPRRRAA